MKPLSSLAIYHDHPGFINRLFPFITAGTCREAPADELVSIGAFKSNLSEASQPGRWDGILRILFFLCLFTATVFFACTKKAPTGPDNEYTCAWNGVDDVAYLDSLACPAELSLLAGPPLLSTATEIHSVKVVYERSSQRIYYVANKHYQLHFDFCKEVLYYADGHALFNEEQYGSGPQRLYYLGNINYYRSSGLYTLEFYMGDLISSGGIDTLYRAVQKTIFFGNELLFFPNSSRFKKLAAEIPEIPVIDEEQIYEGQRYQALNRGEAYGWFRKQTVAEIGSSDLGRHDIVLVNGLPIDLPVIAGIITTVFQTPLSHVNVLSHNRGTPNMALKTAWDDPDINGYIGKLVHLIVTPDTFSIREAEPADAEAFWKKHEPTATITLQCHDDTAGLFDLNNLSHASTPLVGAKAANFAELTKIVLGNDTVPVPEGGFAIPFFYYRQHMHTHGLDTFVTGMLQDSLFRASLSQRETVLKTLRDSIVQLPLDRDFLQRVEQKTASLTNYPSIRFRSSTNAEDIEGFNGAGLYESYSAVRNDPKKTVERAIKKVYAGLWTLRGFEERDYFRIDHKTVAMGILVHRSFPDEEVNGVAITQNIYNPAFQAYTINAQIKEFSIVNPPAGYTADQLLFYTDVENAFTDPTIEYLSHSNINNGNPVMSNRELVELAQWLATIHDHFYNTYYRVSGTTPFSFAMDIEFKLDQTTRKLYIKQARPY